MSITRGLGMNSFGASPVYAHLPSSPYDPLLDGPLHRYKYSGSPAGYHFIQDEIAQFRRKHGLTPAAGPSNPMAAAGPGRAVEVADARSSNSFEMNTIAIRALFLCETEKFSPQHNSVPAPGPSRAVEVADSSNPMAVVVRDVATSVLPAAISKNPFEQAHAIYNALAPYVDLTVHPGHGIVAIIDAFLSAEEKPGAVSVAVDEQAIYEFKPLIAPLD